MIPRKVCSVIVHQFIPLDPRGRDLVGEELARSIQKYKLPHLMYNVNEFLSGEATMVLYDAVMLQYCEVKASEMGGAPQLTGWRKTSAGILLLYTVRYKDHTLKG